jgi:hypothetical protein
MTNVKMVMAGDLSRLRPCGLDLRLPLTTEDGTVLDAWTTVAAECAPRAVTSLMFGLVVLSGPHRGKILQASARATDRALGR